MGVRHGRIVYVGTDSLPAGLIGRGTEVVDLAGRMLLPGFQDGHVHPVESGVELGLCDLNDAETLDAVVGRHSRLGGRAPRGAVGTWRGLAASALS